MDVIAGNIAMKNVTENAAGEPIPYRRRFVVFQSGSAAGENLGVQVARIEEDQSDFELVYDPGHKNAITEGPMKGYVRYPNVDLAMEYIDGMEAARAYDANLASFDLSKNMITNSLRLLA
jgi:flagellar basal-body rod protein FlgC